MASLIPGYEYDIFISYRQKDNKHDGWVTQFVDNLKGELEATFKEDVSVYFDINPHDGLLETHDVDASLKDKLKCLIFIPIISRTYCDPKSFAWEHEFKVFVDQASNDQLGLKVKLQGGNVASRVLPVLIHDLDNVDIKLCESILGGILRSVDFIYKSAGVNRPLLPREENPQENLNHTNYRDQINKVANNIKELITAIENHNPVHSEVSKEVLKPISSSRTNRKTTIIVGSVIALSLIILGFFFISKLLKPTDQLEKSIAVLPFRNDSSNDSTTYFLNGVMEEILINLQKISDFSRVLPRTSTEQYRGSTKTSFPKIAKELNVNYIIEGSGQKYGNKLVLRVQLIAAYNEKHLWGKSYDREIRQTTDIFSIQSEIAQLIAAELKTTITPEEKGLIEKTPTGSLNAYDFYMRGREAFSLVMIDFSNKAALQKAEDFYHTSLKYDSTFALAYTGLGQVYMYKNYFKEYFSKNFLDSVFILANTALSFDDKLADAYYLKGVYYNLNGFTKKAIEEYSATIKLNPNDWKAYSGLGNIYYHIDLQKSIEYLQKAASLNHGSEIPAILLDLSITYRAAGIIEKAKYYAHEEFKLVGDSAEYLFNLSEIEFCQGNYENEYKYLMRAYNLDSADEYTLIGLAGCYMQFGQFKESLKYFNKYLKRKEALGQFDINAQQRIGYSYWKNGLLKEANYYFDKQIEYCKISIENNRNYSDNKYAYYDLAGVYAFRGDKEKAYENLKIFNQKQMISLDMLTFLKDDPLFASIRNESEFKQIVRDFEAKYQAEHERVKKWLQEQGML